MGCPVNLVLASGSPRRRELLTSLGWPFTVRIPEVDESFLNGEDPEKAVVRLAGAKAEAAASGHPDEWIVAADTVVSLEGKILGKPSSRGDASRMLSLLSGKTHTVFTGIAVFSPSGREIGVEGTDVVFRTLGRDEIRAYAESGECGDKAGAYAIQGLGALLVEGIRGDYFNVVGLPLYRLSRMLGSLGFSLSDQWRLKR